VDDLELLARRGGSLTDLEEANGARNSEGVRQKVTCRAGTIGNKCEYLGDQALLDTRFLQARVNTAIRKVKIDSYKLCIELSEPWLASVIEDKHGIYHGESYDM
jgi:hypothetical protein